MGKWLEEHRWKEYLRINSQEVLSLLLAMDVDVELQIACKKSWTDGIMGNAQLWWKVLNSF